MPAKLPTLTDLFFLLKLDILSVGGDTVTDKNKTSKPIEINSNLDNENNKRHNENARAAAANDPGIPRIDTENL
jgi:hypothetical protein